MGSADRGWTFKIRQGDELSRGGVREETRKCCYGYGPDSKVPRGDACLAPNGAEGTRKRAACLSPGLGPGVLAGRAHRTCWLGVLMRVPVASWRAFCQSGLESPLRELLVDAF
jgi:hypothetical protein